MGVVRCPVRIDGLEAARLDERLVAETAAIDILAAAIGQDGVIGRAGDILIAVAGQGRGVNRLPAGLDELIPRVVDAVGIAAGLDVLFAAESYRRVIGVTIDILCAAAAHIEVDESTPPASVYPTP